MTDGLKPPADIQQSLDEFTRRQRKGEGGVYSTIQCSRCWTKYRRKRYLNITLVEGTAYCLECVDERNAAQDAAVRAMNDAWDASQDGMTIADLFRWIKKHVFGRSG